MAVAGAPTGSAVAMGQDSAQQKTKQQTELLAMLEEAYGPTIWEAAVSCLGRQLYSKVACTGGGSFHSGRRMGISHSQEPQRRSVSDTGVSVTTHAPRIICTQIALAILPVNNGKRRLLFTVQ
eukprot:364682-Chlamydomonas_euryale.AAC.19